MLQLVKTPARTPENTPIPGGGRWCWDYDLCTWLAVPEPVTADPIAASAPAIDAIPATDPNQE